MGHAVWGWLFLAVMFCPYMFTLPQDYFHVSFQRPLMTNESHLAKPGPTTARLKPSLVQQSSHHFVNLQKQYKTYFPLTMTSAEKVLYSPLLSQLFLRDIFIFQTNMRITLALMPNLNTDRIGLAQVRVKWNILKLYLVPRIVIVCY